MNIYRYILVGLGLILFLYTVGLVVIDNNPSNIVYVETDDLNIGEIKFVDDREIYDFAQHIYLKAEGNNGVGSRVVLLFHGYLGSPQEVNELAEYLNEAGFDVVAPLMAGHGSDPQDLLSVSYNDWESEAKEYYHAMDTIYDEVSVIGFSLGSLNALSIAQDNDVSGSIVAIGPPIYFGNGVLDTNELSLILDVLAEYVPEISKPGGFTDKLVGRETYKNVPLENVEEVFDYSKEVTNNLDLIEERILLIHGQYDFVADPESSLYVYETVASTQKELLEVSSLHPVLMGIHKQDVFESILSFIEVQEE